MNAGQAALFSLIDNNVPRTAVVVLLLSATICGMQGKAEGRGRGRDAKKGFCDALCYFKLCRFLDLN